MRVPFDLDHPYWIEDADFDLEFHVRHIALPKPGDWRQLCIQAARLHSRPLDLSRPLWEIYVDRGPRQRPGRPAGSFALVQKTHHAAVDGVSGMEMIDRDPRPLARRPDRPPERRTGSRRPMPAPWQLLMRAGVNNALDPCTSPESWAAPMPAFGRVQSQLRRRQLKLPPMSAPRTRFNGNVTAHRVVEGRRFSLADARKAKSAVEGATINDVVLSVVGGALRAYLDATRASCPTSRCRPWRRSRCAARTRRARPATRCRGWWSRLASNIADPLDRLVAVRQSTHQSKEFSQAVGARTLSDYSQFIPGGLAGLARAHGQPVQRRPAGESGREHHRDERARPPRAAVLRRCRMVTLVGMGPVTDGMGLIHPITSYCDELIIAATSCREMMPDPASTQSASRAPGTIS